MRPGKTAVVARLSARAQSRALVARATRSTAPCISLSEFSAVFLRHRDLILRTLYIFFCVYMCAFIIYIFLYYIKYVPLQKRKEILRRAKSFEINHCALLSVLNRQIIIFLLFIMYNVHVINFAFIYTINI